MKIWTHIYKAPIRVLRLQRRRSLLKLKRTMLALKAAMSQEKAETKQMLQIYRRYTKRQASKAEMAIANQQFVDLVKGVGIGVVAILPFAPITLPIFIKLGKIVGVDILPSSFSTQQSTKKIK